jgi:hypothetical protein
MYVLLLIGWTLMTVKKNKIFSNNEALDYAITESFMPSKERYSNSTYKDWNYLAIQCEYERSDCNGNCNDYCRCTSITITGHKNYSPSAIVRSISEKIESKFLKYAVDRIVHHLKLDNSFETAVVGGYYGEETGGTYLTSNANQNMITNLTALKDLSDIDIVKYVLTMEYGYLLDSIKDCQEVEITEIDLNLISFNNEYRKKIDNSENYYDEKYDQPRGIFIKNGEKYRLIDGYHRVGKANQLKMKTINAIVIK